MQRMHKSQVVKLKLLEFEGCLSARIGIRLNRSIYPFLSFHVNLFSELIRLSNMNPGRPFPLIPALFDQLDRARGMLNC